ncbi:MAG: acyltransferase [Erythrobacter sp.]
MEKPLFVTPSMSILLDAVRAGAALLVLGGHAVQLGIYTGPYPFNAHMQHNAVVVFFVLSGLVIAHSVQQRNYTLGEYAIARSARILPVSLFGLALGTSIFLALSWAGLLPGIQVHGARDLLVSSILLPALFLSESWSDAEPLLNPPYWSLTYEVWFYAIFAAAHFMKGSPRMIWVAIVALSAGMRILLLLPVWLMGVALVHYGTRWLPRGGQAALLAAVALASMVASDQITVLALYASYLLNVGLGFSADFSEYFLSDYLLGIGISLMFIAARPFADWAAGGLERARKPIEWLAGFSFSLYLLHWPILSAFSALGVKAGDSPLIFAGLVAGILGFCAFTAHFTEYRSRGIRAWLTRRFAATQTQTAVA